MRFLRQFAALTPGELTDVLIILIRLDRRDLPQRKKMVEVWESHWRQVLTAGTEAAGSNSNMGGVYLRGHEPP